MRMRLVPAVPTSSARRAAAVLGGRTAGWIATLLGLSFSVHTPTAAAQMAAPAAKQAGKDKGLLGNVSDTLPKL